MEAVGVYDALDCASGSLEGCGWLAAGLIPVGKIGKLAKLSGKANDAAGVRSILSGLSKGKQSNVRVVGSEAELKGLFVDLIQGGQIVTSPSSYPGVRVSLADGTTVGLRAVSASGGATIDVTLAGGKYMKVHIA